MMSISTVIFLSLLFFLSEITLMLAKRSKKATEKIHGDGKSLILFWITIPATLTFGFFLADYRVWHAQQIYIGSIGVGLVVLGLIIRWLAIWQLKNEFTVDVAIAKNHQLKNNGLYNLIRHPSYTGLMLICSGLAVAMNSLPSFLVIFIPVFAVLLYRIRVEENTMIKAFGSAYLAYMQKTKKLVPKIY